MKKTIISLISVAVITAVYFILSYKDAIIANRNNHESYPFYTTGLNDEHLIAHAGEYIDLVDTDFLKSL